MAEIISKKKFEDIMVRGKDEKLKRRLTKDMQNRRVEVEREKRK